MILKNTATFQVLFIVSLFSAWNITTVEINSGVHLLKSQIRQVPLFTFGGLGLVSSGLGLVTLFVVLRICSCLHHCYWLAHVVPESEMKRLLFLATETKNNSGEHQRVFLILFLGFSTIFGCSTWGRLVPTLSPSVANEPCVTEGFGSLSRFNSFGFSCILFYFGKMWEW